MANAYSSIKTYSPVDYYDEQFIGQAVAAKQSKYDLGLLRAEKALSDVTNIDLAKSEDINYLHNRLSSVIEAANDVSSLDFSDRNIIRGLESHISQAIDENVANAYASTQIYRKEKSDWDNLRQSSPDKYNVANHYVSMRDANAWLNDGKVGSSYSGGMGVTEYVDVNAKLLKEVPKILKDFGMQEELRLMSTSPGGLVKNYGKYKSILPDKVNQAIQSVIGDKEQTQLRINSIYQDKDKSDQEIADNYRGFLSNKANYVKRKIEDINKGIAVGEIKDKSQANYIKSIYENSLESYNFDFLPSRDDMSNAMYLEDFKSGYVNLFQKDPVLVDFKQDKSTLEEKKYNLSVSRFTSDNNYRNRRLALDEAKFGLEMEKFQDSKEVDQNPLSSGTLSASSASRRGLRGGVKEELPSAEQQHKNNKARALGDIENLYVNNPRLFSELIRDFNSVYPDSDIRYASGENVKQTIDNLTDKQRADLFLFSKNNTKNESVKIAHNKYSALDEIETEIYDSRITAQSESLSQAGDVLSKSVNFNTENFSNQGFKFVGNEDGSYSVVSDDGQDEFSRIISDNKDKDFADWSKKDQFSFNVLMNEHLIKIDDFKDAEAKERAYAYRQEYADKIANFKTESGDSSYFPKRETVEEVTVFTNSIADRIGDAAERFISDPLRSISPEFGVILDEFSTPEERQQAEQRRQDFNRTENIKNVIASNRGDALTRLIETDDRITALNQRDLLDSNGEKLDMGWITDLTSGTKTKLLTEGILQPSVSLVNSPKSLNFNPSNKDQKEAYGEIISYIDPFLPDGAKVNKSQTISVEHDPSQLNPSGLPKGFVTYFDSADKQKKTVEVELPRSYFDAVSTEAEEFDFKSYNSSSQNAVRKVDYSIPLKASDNERKDFLRSYQSSNNVPAEVMAIYQPTRKHTFDNEVLRSSDYGAFVSSINERLALDGLPQISGSDLLNKYLYNLKPSHEIDTYDEYQEAYTDPKYYYKYYMPTPDGDKYMGYLPELVSEDVTNSLAIEAGTHKFHQEFLKSEISLGENSILYNNILDILLDQQ